ncbi:hypothetical protein COCSUDRAFT_61172 [Coccomyxa subellipsoidea C-169]|uniref:Uncharacterized protein n=1 Tax=Coccomyxa subellipsoidea (strain C-169) TaxID=574566 RepID=I0YM85_COCSC|nr:hypothetical protein COCSUDRAFT_58780 [Coccomyxa subellipsoidea C-169]XP_005650728.1 hypothetical protein COCSUDRAFT_61172 [Coccomyxa subellipsoidea C-169]EIE19504.1 hypothetical protein COCSUDRAFT_58780 [Coccomyxa subellipsoidea C-169]EIE26184.1 hypothetical protein COCSUDRAFT_61172 [Coccomyxa subellipsoidea C-169]|eukprot:XP_005644048.1 hypothetical protein COCSUDRAFT_58780 [Coccomyxa subellipsoidea C-169]
MKRGPSCLNEEICRILGSLLLLVAVGLTASSWLMLAFLQTECNHPECFQPVSEEPPLTIFVSIASYRDPECKTTMQEMFAKAANPHRVFAGSVQQIYEFHEACWHTGLPWGDHVRSITVPFADAKGPTNARHMAASLYRGEDYFMQIDSHTTFIQDWDNAIIAMLDRCPSDKCFISHYPPAHNDTDSVQVPILCKSHFDEGAKMPSFEAMSFDFKLGEFADSPFVGAGFQLSSADVLLDVPFDPKLDMMFVGEEILYSARLWTKGWDLFAPDLNIVKHHYNRVETPNIYRDRTEEWYYPQQESNKRARYMLGMNETAPEGETESSLKYYGMGDVRSLDAYWEYAQIDVKERVANSAEKFCKKHVKKREPDPEERPKQAAKQPPQKKESRSLRSMLSAHIFRHRRR